MENVNLSDFKFKHFKPVWNRIKYGMKDIHFDLFYKVVAIDETLGRRWYPGSGREYNPMYYSHWFASGRCHWNVILPCFMLNGDKFNGDFKIITNDKHSAIIDLANKKAFCPTLNSEEDFRRFFSEGFQIIDLANFLPSVLQSISGFDFFIEKYYENK